MGRTGPGTAGAGAGAAVPWPAPAASTSSSPARGCKANCPWLVVVEVVVSGSDGWNQLICLDIPGQQVRSGERPVRPAAVDRS